MFRELLWAEATLQGIGKNLINVPSAITVADGGIDAEVSGAYTTSRQGLIKQGMTRYQIKTGSFNLSQDSYIKEILFKKDSQELKPRVKSCFDNSGTFVVVLFGWDNPEIADDQIENKFRAQMEGADPKYNVSSV